MITIKLPRRRKRRKKNMVGHCSRSESQNPCPLKKENLLCY
jgi:hypothetical protein